MRRARHGGGEINLTPLLDVLFSILFIVLLAGAQNERANADAAKEEADGLREEIAELETLRAQLESAEIIREGARVVTVSNFMSGGVHRLRVAVDGDTREPEVILLGTSRLENVSARLGSLAEDVINDSGGFPVYIFFHCDKDAIYRREYEAVVRTLEELQREHKEVFLRIAEKNEEEHT